MGLGRYVVRTRQQTPAAVSGPPFQLGILIGCVPILIAVGAAIGVVHCHVGPMSFGYCSSGAEELVLSLGLLALGSAALELLVGLSSLLVRRVRRLGAGLVLMALVFIPASVLALYAVAFVALLVHF